MNWIILFLLTGVFAVGSWLHEQPKRSLRVVGLFLQTAVIATLTYSVIGLIALYSKIAMFLRGG